MMSDNELDTVYTTFCKTLSEVGEPDAPLFLARFALLAIVHIGKADAVLELISQAATVNTQPQDARRSSCPMP